MPQIRLDVALYWVTIACLLIGLIWQDTTIDMLRKEVEILKKKDAYTIVVPKKEEPEMKGGM